MIVSCAEMQALERLAFEHGATPESLMDEAGQQIALAVRQFFPQPGVCIVFFGKGHNGGDALTAARHLGELGWKVHLVEAFSPDHWAPLTLKKFHEAGRARRGLPAVHELLGARPIIALDGLLGIGARGNLRGAILDSTQTMSGLRKSLSAKVIAIDVPTGLDADSGIPGAESTIADFTCAIGFVKAGLVADAAIDYVGRLVVLPLAPLRNAASSCADSPSAASPDSLHGLLPPRRFDSHKGDYGRIGIVAGSRDFTGAARLCAQACLHAGGGLITLYATKDIHQSLAAAAPPEIMVRCVDSYLEVLGARHDVIGIGPGLGRDRPDEVLELIRTFVGPMIVDADALNILATQMTALDTALGPRLLTPHPGEMDRLDPQSKGCQRADSVRRFTEAHRAVLLLKGARTVIGERGHPLSFNTTGNPGMATGGMGDALTGVCAALAGRGLPLYDVARLGAWLCGRASEIALSHGSDSEESLSPTGMMRHLGLAFRDLNARCF